MTPEKFAEFVKDVIEEEVTTSPPCSCCGTVEIEGVTTAANRIASAIESIAKQEVERCGRCGNLIPVEQIQVTGPYRACSTCTTIIRS